MPAPECRCQINLIEGPPLIRCPLHEAAGDLYTALETVTHVLEISLWHALRGAIEDDEKLRKTIAEHLTVQLGHAALLKANPQRTTQKEDKNDA